MMPDDGYSGETPQPDTVYTLAGLPASLLHSDDYPVRAVCQEHGKPMRSDSFSAPWYHIDVDPDDLA